MHGRHLIAALAVPAIAAGGLALTSPASAAVACRVDYAVASQWSGGFVANVTVHNLGDPVSSWTVAWAFMGGQKISSGWNATVTQSGTQVSAANVSYNGSIATNGTASFGFQGTNSGTTNPVPTAFTLNGTACTGSVPTGTTTTTRPATTTTTRPATTTTTSRTTTTTTRTTTTTTRATTTGGVVWSSSDQWATWTEGDYTLYNDIWGSGAGPQTIWANSHSNWGVHSDQPNTGGVKSYPNASRPVNKTLSALSSVSSTFAVTVPSSGAYETAYDIWADNNAYEIMLWMNKTGAVGPLGTLQTTATVGGHTWQIYKGSNGANQVFSFVRTSNTSSGTVDILAVLKWIQSSGWFGNATLGNVQFGYEITSSSGGLDFTTTNYSVSYS